MTKRCRACGHRFQDGDKLVAIMLSEYKALDSDVHYAITVPTKCVDILHQECCTDFPPNYVEEANS